MDVNKLAYDLTMSTVEVEGVEYLSDRYNHVVIGQIIEVLPHPNSEILKICKTNIGSCIKEIVCGGKNVYSGMVVVVALVGAEVSFHGQSEKIIIANTSIRGIESDSMICAANELGLQDIFAHGEQDVIDLSEYTSIEIGMSLVDFLGMTGDVILDIDNKSLSNRPDLWGHYGIARELAALYDLDLKPLDCYKSECSHSMEINIDDKYKCPRYIGVKIQGVDARESSLLFKTKIWRVGLKPINALVDITNYVMLAVGQPMHAYDALKINGSLHVRNAISSEKSISLNKDMPAVRLSEKDLVIADDDGVIALAGVIGSSDKSVGQNTGSIILEVANFDANLVRSTVLRNDVRTDASNRFEKGIDFERCDQALGLAMKIFSEIFPSLNVVEYSDNCDSDSNTKFVELSLKWAMKYLGKAVNNSFIQEKLQRLGFGVHFSGDLLQLEVPSWRATGDISIPNDIIEEIARIYGLENFELAPITTTFIGAINQIDVDVDRKMREYLAIRCGMQEVYNYPWMNDKYIDALCLDRTSMLSLSTPSSPDEKYLRSSLLPNLLKTVSFNLKNFTEFNIFESSQILLNKNFASLTDKNELLPEQRKTIAGAFVGRDKDYDSIFKKAKGIIMSLSRFCHLNDFELVQINKPLWADNIIHYNIKHMGNIVGTIAKLGSKAALECNIKNACVVLFEIDLDMIIPLSSRHNVFEHIAEYPMTDYDISMLFDITEKWCSIEESVSKINEQYIQKIEYIGIYNGKQVPEGKKSITFRLLIGSKNMTLKSADIEATAKRVINLLEDKFGAQLRN